MLIQELFETKLNPQDPTTDYREKMKVLYDLELNPQVDPKVVQQRRLDLKREFEKLSEGKVLDFFKKSALASALVSALIVSPAQADSMTDNPIKKPVPQTQEQEREAFQNALTIFRSIMNMKKYGKEGLEGEARQELNNILRSIQGHPNQTKIVPIVKDIIKTPIEKT
jgi:hypothetical protein